MKKSCFRTNQEHSGYTQSIFRSYFQVQLCSLLPPGAPQNPQDYSAGSVLYHQHKDEVGKHLLLGTNCFFQANS